MTTMPPVTEGWHPTDDTKAPAKAGAAKHAKAAASVLTAPAITIGLSYVIHLVVAFALSWALSHGFHFSIGVLPLSLTTFSGTTLGKLILRNLSESWHTGAVHGQHQGQQDIITKMTAEVAKMDPDALAKILGNLGNAANKTSKGAGPYL